MTRLLIGFFLGLMVAAAVGRAQVVELPPYSPSIGAIIGKIVLKAAADPNGDAAVIKVDAEGRVICSPESQK